MSCTSNIPYDSPSPDVNNTTHLPTCIHCDELLLNSNQVVVKCCDSCGYHKSRCVNCLLMEIDDCCVEISSEMISTVTTLLESKLSKDTVHAQESTDFFISNYLEFALESRVWLDDYTDDASQVTSTDAEDYTLKHPHPTVERHCPSGPTFHHIDKKFYDTPENHHKHHMLSLNDYHRHHFDSERPLLNDDNLDFYIHEPEVPATNLSTWEDLAIDELPDYIDEDRLSGPESEIEIICNDLG